MKYTLAAMALSLTFAGVANAQYPEFNPNMDVQSVVEFQDQIEPARDCDEPPPKTTEWTCFARDSRGGSLGVSTSFTRRDLAAGRALNSCRRKSSIPDTCHITLCKQPPPPDCNHGHNN